MLDIQGLDLYIIYLQMISSTEANGYEMIQLLHLCPTRGQTSVRLS
jgi:hypothetical protein